MKHIIDPKKLAKTLDLKVWEKYYETPILDPDCWEEGDPKWLSYSFTLSSEEKDGENMMTFYMSEQDPNLVSISVYLPGIKGKLRDNGNMLTVFRNITKVSYLTKIKKVIIEGSNKGTRSVLELNRNHSWINVTIDANTV